MNLKIRKWPASQSEEMRAIHAHMSPKERRGYMWRALLTGGSFGLVIPFVQGVTVLSAFYGNFLVILGVFFFGCVLLLWMANKIRKLSAESLCATSWAQAQGYRPEKLPGFHPLQTKNILGFVLICILPLAAFLALSGTGYRMFKPQPSTATQLVASWRWYGMWVPDADEIAFLKGRLPNSLEALGSGLKDPNPTIRRCTAVAVEEIGPVAKPLIPNLKKALAKETDQLVRVYFAKAFGPIGDSSPTTIAFLRATFANETDSQVKSYLQGSITTLGKAETRAMG